MNSVAFDMKLSYFFRYLKRFGIMKYFLVLAAVCFGLPASSIAQCRQSVTQVGGSQARNKRICSGDLIFHEKFDYLNENLWNHEHQVDGCGNGEFQQYVNDRSISFTQGGKLFIRPKVVGDVPLNNGFFNPVKSARMTTAGKFTFRYGKLEARAKIPAGDWLWPAIWMLPQDFRYGGWPVSGEIDIMESRGNKNLYAWGGNIGSKLILSTLHWGRSPRENLFQKTSYQKRWDGGFDWDFHNYYVEWTPDHIAFRVDGREIGRVTPPGGGFHQFGGLSGHNPWSWGSKMAPFDQQFFLILNVAIGGTNGYFPDEMSNPGGKPWKNWSPQAARDFWNGNWQWRPTWNEQSNPNQRALEVDYIKIWAL